MTNGLTIRQLLTTPIAWSRNEDHEQARKASALLRRHASAVRKAHAERRRLLSEIERAASVGEPARLEKASRQLADAVRQLRVLEDLARYEVRETNIYEFSSLMLKQSFAYCTARPEEGMHFILGVEKDGCAIGTAIVPFEYAHRSIAGAAGVHRSTQKICIEAHESNHRILALIHSHPGSGINANHHSSTDAATQELWERTTRMIGGIWSRDGYLRWYSLNLVYKVQILGNHMERVEGNVWRLRTNDELETPPSTGDGRDLDL